jgi:subtilisin-like proprotein convertase family protein
MKADTTFIIPSRLFPWGPMMRANHKGRGKRCLLRWLAVTACLLALTTGSRAQNAALPATTQKLNQPLEILLSLSTNATTRVIVNLRPVGGSQTTLAAANLESAASLQLWQDSVRQAQESVLAGMPLGCGRVRYRFENIPAFSIEITAAGLEALQANDRVLSIDVVRELQPHLAQGIPLIHAETYRSLYNGAGVAVAICDTGVDYTHARLGGSAFPNSKVLGGYDFGDHDADPAPNGHAHGTCCAGIVAGDLGTVGDYIGGVAHNAKLYALKISNGTTGNASDDAMIAAWDWCVTHRNDNPNYPLLVISTSFGGNRYYSTCDGVVTAMTTAANNAVAAGITIVVSSGNDGYCDSIGWPACISSVISVGAVYDASLGSVSPCVSANSCVSKIAGGTCSSGYYAVESAVADKVTAYANVASFLGLFAPANNCSTLDISGAGGYSTGDYTSTFGGTSAACPYAAGAIACLQAAAKAIRGSYLSPGEIRSRLTSSGNMVSDTKATITKPRVNLANAIAALNSGSSLTNDSCNGAVVITSSNYSVTQSTAGATATGDPTPSCVTGFGAGVWYRFIPAAAGQLTVNTEGSSFDTGLALYSGDCGDWTQANCDDDSGSGTTSAITNTVVAGVAYYILAGGYNAATGTLSLQLTFTAQSRAVDHFSWATIASPQTAGVAFPVNLTARDVDEAVVTNFTGSVALSAGVAGGGAVFSDNFEDGSISDWTIESGSYTRLVDYTGANGTSRSLTLSGGSGSYYDGVSRVLGGITPAQVSFYIRASTTTAAGAGFFTIGTGKSRSSSAAQFSMQADGLMGLYDGVYEHMTWFDADQWYKITLQFDWPAHEIAYYVDDALIEANVPFCSSSVNSLTILSLYNVASTQVWYDQIEMGDGGTPPPISPTASGSFVNGTWTGNVTIASAAANVVLTANDGTGHAGSGNPFNVVGVTNHAEVAVILPPAGGTVPTVISTNGGSYTFEASGMPAWLTVTVNGSVISGSETIITQGSITLNSTATTNSSGDTRTWTLPVTWQGGSCDVVYSQAAYFAPPAISTQPQNRTNLVGTTATFSVAASGALPLSYQWRKNGTTLSDAGNISGASTPALSLSNVQSASAGSYSVVITNSGGAVTSLVAVLTVDQLPALGIAPASHDFGTISIGGMAERAFWVSNSGGGTVSGTATTATPFGIVSGGSYNLASGQGQAVVVRYTPSGSGTHSGTVTFSGAAGATASVLGVATNPVLQYAFTNTAAITINDAAVGDIPAAGSPYPSAIIVGGLTGVVNHVAVTLRGFTHSYPHDVGVLLVDPEGHKVVVMANSGGYGLNNVTLTFDDSAASALVEFPSSATVSGTYKPSNCGDGDTTFPAGAPAGPYAVALSACNGANPNGTWSLYVQDDVNGDPGSFTDGWSLALSLDAPQQPPVLTSLPQSATVVAGRNAGFTVAATGSGALTYQWQRFGTNLANTARVSGVGSRQLWITNVAGLDAGTYSVAVSNAVGWTNSPAVLLTVAPAWTPLFSEPGMASNEFSATLLGASCSNYLVQVSSDLKSWKTLRAVTLTNGIATIRDSSAGMSQRFYRAMLLP